MSKQLFTNNATSTLSGILPQGGTTLVCGAGHGSRFPTPGAGEYFLLTLFTKDAYAIEQEVEVVKVTARAGDVLTIERDVEQLTGEIGGRAYNGSTTTVFLELRWTALSASNALQAGDNLASIGNAATARSSLGLGNVDNTTDLNKPVSTATQAALDAHTAAGDPHPQYATAAEVIAMIPVQSVAGKTGTVTLVKGDVGLGSVDNTTDLNKPISTATQTALNSKASLTGAETLTNKTLTGYTETIYDVTGTTPSLNPANGTIQTWTLTANSTPTAASFVAGQSITLMVDDGTSYTITWPSVTWVNGSAPTLKTTGYTVVVLWKVGSTLYGRY